ncbi:unnamed protein product [Meganyctiphanes norvegica]|uniref:Cilia- and flagella-associated protein 97 n=1 Tax=Meganyctiphanes norvegica TaxID=48144 RepID=A0AAV2PRK5_MEGNR
MAHRIGLNDTVYEPDIHSQVDFSFFDESDSEERTKGTKSKVYSDSNSLAERNGFVEQCVVNGAAESSGSSYSNSFSSQTQLVPGSSPQTKLEDTSCAGQGGTLEQSGWCLGAPEGHQEDPRRPPLAQTEGNVSDSPRGCGSGAEAAVANAGATEGAEEHTRKKGSDPPSDVGASLAAQTESAGATNTEMDRADLNPYSSDEWEDSEISDSASDHSDSSDDDDPKSQVDRLIERGTRLYMEGTDSNVSDTDSDSDEDDDFSDSESDITDVSPLVSGKSSPLRLSPIMARRSNTCTSPLAIHDNKNLEFDWPTRQENSKYHLEDNHHSSDQGYESTQPNHFSNTFNHHLHHDNLSHDDPTDMTLLLQAVMELEKTQHKSHNRQNTRNGEHHNNHHNVSSPHLPLSSIHASPHTRHLGTPRRTHNSRKNMSFTNDEVRRIDRENQILLQKIMTAHTASTKRNSGAQHSVHHRGPVHKPSNSSVTRRREEEKIRRENMYLSESCPVHFYFWIETPSDEDKNY